MPRYVVSIRRWVYRYSFRAKFVVCGCGLSRNDSYFLVPNGAPFLGLYKISIFAFNNPASMYVVKD